MCLCKKRVENFPSFQTTRGGEREKVKAAADEHTQKPPTISKEPEESYDADRKAGRNGFLFFFGPQLSSPSFAYMIINLLLFLTFCQQQHHHHRSRAQSRSLSRRVRTHSVLIPHKENFSTLNIFFLQIGKYFCCASVRGAFASAEKNFLRAVFALLSASRLMIIKCTTSGSCQIISHLTPHAIGRRQKIKENNFFSGKISFCE